MYKCNRADLSEIPHSEGSLKKGNQPILKLGPDQDQDQDQDQDLIVVKINLSQILRPRQLRGRL